MLMKMNTKFSSSRGKNSLWRKMRRYPPETVDQQWVVVWSLLTDKCRRLSLGVLCGGGVVLLSDINCRFKCPMVDKVSITPRLIFICNILGS